MSDTDSGSAPETGTEADTTTTETPASGDGGSGFDSSPWQELADETGLSPSQIRKRLEHARTWEQRAKDNKAAADAKKSLEDQVGELREAMAQRDLADVDRAARMALTQVKAQLAERGIKAEDATPLLEHVDATRLLAEGDVDAKAVTKLAESLAKVAGRAAPDPDQGRTGGTPTDMNSMIRRMAGRH